MVSCRFLKYLVKKHWKTNTKAINFNPKQEFIEETYEKTYFWRFMRLNKRDFCCRSLRHGPNLSVELGHCSAARSICSWGKQIASQMLCSWSALCRKELLSLSSQFIQHSHCDFPLKLCILKFLALDKLLLKIILWNDISWTHSEAIPELRFHEAHHITVTMAPLLIQTVAREVQLNRAG